MCNAFKELEAEWMERGIKQSNQQAIISMLEFGITKEQIITRYTKEELENYIKDIKKKGNKLILTKSYVDVKNYKTTIKNYLKAVVDYTYTLNKNIGFWENQYYSTVETINKKLESLTNELLSEEKENLDISSTIDIIQGLLIDIYK